MSAQEGKSVCHFCLGPQDDKGKCVPCTRDNDLSYVGSRRWEKLIYLTINDKEYCIRISNISSTYEVYFLDETPKLVLEIPRNIKIAPQNVREKLKTYLLFL